MVQTVWLTQAGKSRLEEELQDLRTRRRPELHARIQEATESGDISDNSEYEELKDEWASLEARIFDLEQTLDHSEIIQREDGDDAPAARAEHDPNSSEASCLRRLSACRTSDWPARCHFRAIFRTRSRCRAPA